MATSSPRMTAVTLLALALAAACGTGAASPGTVRPGGTTDAARSPAAQQAPAASERRHSEADVRFMQGMILHHAQALAMTSLVADRSEREAIRLLARRIELSQDDEIALMTRWLKDRGESVPEIDAARAPHAHSPDAHAGHHGGAGRPLPTHGMLTDEELARLAAATGDAFDRLFLEFMIRHHEGALVMVAELFASDRAAQETETFEFASHVESDQRVEIARMRMMLGTNPPPQ